MRKYSVQSNYYHGYNAGSKAVNDVCQILNGLGYDNYYINYYRNTKKSAFSIFIDMFRLFRFLHNLNNKDELFVQWPLYINPLFKRIFLMFLKYKRVKIITLIHDVEDLRMNSTLIDISFIELLKLSDKIIVHSENMKQYLCSLGINKKGISILTTFDYLTNDVIPCRVLSNKVVFAGNLLKSEFLDKIEDSVLDEISLMCYGKGNEFLNKKIIYKGFFNPDDVAKLEGSWGLVWDGNSAKTCSGVYGEYLRYNSPHKMSMYLASGLPLIVWNESALASYVDEKGIGIAINSIDQIPDAIKNVSVEQYSGFIHNVQKVGYELRKGLHLKNAII